MKPYLQLHKCSTCAVYNPKEKVCGFLQHPIENAEEFFCGFYTTELTPCSICGQNLMDFQAKEMYIEHDNCYHICDACKQKIGWCQTCSQARFCNFETDPSPLPKVVQKVVTQGNMHQVFQVKNPERVKACCPGCKCWSTVENKCLRENGTCVGFVPAWRKN